MNNNQLEKNKHISEEEILQDISDTQREIIQYKKELAALEINSENRVAIYFKEGNILKRKDFIKDLYQLLEYKRTQTSKTYKMKKQYDTILDAILELPEWTDEKKRSETLADITTCLSYESKGKRVYGLDDCFKRALLEIELAEGNNLCGTCNGSGEGMWDGSTCSNCGGSGEDIRGILEELEKYE